MKTTLGRQFWCMVLLQMSVVIVARAGTPPILDYDIPVVLSCTDVTPAAYSAKYPDKKLVEIKFPISATIKQGREADLESVSYNLGLVGSSVVDFVPKTRLEAEISGPIRIVEQTTSGISGALRVEYSASTPVGTARADGNLSAGRDTQSQVSYERLPPRAVVLTAGRDDGGRTATFGLAPSDRDTLLGEKEYGLICEVDRAWRGGFGESYLIAKGIDRGKIYNSKVLCGFRSRLCLVYLDGEEDLKQLAENISDSVRSLNSDLSTPLDIVQKNEVAILSSQKYSVEEDVTRPRTPNALTDELAAFYFAAQRGRGDLADKKTTDAWDAEITALDNNLKACDAIGKRGFRPAFRIYRSAEKIAALYDKCFRPTHFNADEYNNDNRQEEEMVKSLPD